VVEPCGVLMLVTEGAFEARDRINTAVHERYPEMSKAPIVWGRGCPTLLANGAAEALTAIIRKAAEACTARFQLPLGLVIIDVLTDAAGYAKAGDENDAAIGARIMGVLRRASEACNCHVMALDHFGKTIEAGTRGTIAKESAADTVLACLGEREVAGSVVNTRLALRKVRGGPQGQEFPYKLRARPVFPEKPDDDGATETTCVIEWSAHAAGKQDDLWEAGRQADTVIAMRTLRRAMMKLLAEHGIDLTLESGDPAVRAIDEERVREEFNANTVAEGTPEQKQEAKRKRFRRTRDRAQKEGLIGRHEIDGVVYLWFK
jgi:AAA domain